MSTPTEPTPAELRALAADTETLGLRIRAMHDRMGASAHEEVRRAAFRLGTAEGPVRITAREAIEETAADLEKILEARAPGACGIPFGVCPEHGNTLRGSAGETWCRVGRCGRHWSYDRVTLPCTEPVTHKAVDQEGTVLPVCNGHALDAEQRLEGATITRIAPIE